MIITLKGADFSQSNIGTLDSWFISWSGSGLTAAAGNASSIKKDDTAGLTLTYTYNTENYEYVSGTVTDATGASVGSVSASNGTVTVTINAGNTINGKITIAISMNYIGTGEEPDNGGEEDTTPEVPPTTGETVTFTLDTATTASTTEMVHTTQSIGSAVAYQEAGTRGVVTWDIPAYAIVTLTVATGGSYGMALTDRNNIVLASTPTANATDGTITFPIQTVPTRVHASKAKFTSGSYTTYSEEELKGMELPVGFSGAISGQYVNTSQTIGSPVVLVNMSSTSYNISNPIPANTQVTITCTGTNAGGYGMALCDTSGNVIEYINHSATASTDNKHTFTAQTVETKLYVSVNKFDSAVYTLV